MEPNEVDEVKLLKVINKVHTIEAQERLILLVKDNPQLLQSKILSSLQPKVGKQFSYKDLEINKRTLLINVRKQLMDLAAEERRRDLRTVESKLRNLYQSDEEVIKLNSNLQSKVSVIKNRINEKMNKKVQFHDNNVEKVSFTSNRTMKRTKRKAKTKENRKRNRRNYKMNQRNKRQNRRKSKVEEIIKDNIVINLSNIEIPDNVYLYLAKGLNFVPTKSTNTHSLKFDAQNFIRKLEWKAFFTQHPEFQNNVDNCIHRDLLVQSNKHPDFQHTCIDNVKVKLFGWIANHQFKTPKSNLTKAECQGRKWIMEKVKERKLFVSKADKGGATLILDYDTVIEEIEKELFNKDKYELLNKKADAHSDTIINKIKTIILDLNQKKIITDKDKTLITGLNKNNKMKHSPEYRPVTPYIYTHYLKYIN